MKRLSLLLLALGFVPYIIAHQISPLGQNNCGEHGVIMSSEAQPTGVEGYLTIVNVSGAKHQGELLITDKPFKPNQQVALCSGPHGNRFLR